MNKYDFIFIVLTYRNTDDLTDFFSANKIEKSKNIVVNSFYDDESNEKFKEIALKNDAIFLSVPNKGYGAGNNYGCKYALENFNFKYLIISNADIIIEALNIQMLDNYSNYIIAPKILNLKNKNQNPSLAFVPSHPYDIFRKLIFKSRFQILMYIPFAFARLTKTLFYLLFPLKKFIFSAHGAFVIFPKKIIDKLYPLYNEQMFLFNEEEHLGRLAKQKKIKTIYNPQIVIRHKEDGSMKISSTNVNNQLKKSFLIYYDYWFIKKNN